MRKDAIVKVSIYVFYVVNILLDSKVNIQSSNQFDCGLKR